MPQDDPVNVLLTEGELAKRWNYHPSTLSNQRSRGRGIPFVRIGPRSCRYRLSDVLAYEETIYPHN